VIPPRFDTTPEFYKATVTDIILASVERIRQGDFIIQAKFNRKINVKTSTETNTKNPGHVRLI
jgi:hypothetical protein